MGDERDFRDQIKEHCSSSFAATEEQVALDHLSFTHAQVRDFREIFVEHAQLAACSVRLWFVCMI